MMLGSLLRHQSRRNYRFFSTAYTYSATGDPSSVLSRTSLKNPVAPSGTNLHVSWLAAGVDPVDLATLSGSPSARAFNPASLPAVPGHEGVASVTAVGPDVSGISEGDLVIPITSAVGTWCESGVVDASHVMSIPSTMRIELAATLSASPFTAIRLLSDFVTMNPGDVVLQNAGGGPVGTAVVQIARILGLQTISLVNTPYSDYAPTVERLKHLGADVVIGENYTKSAGFRAVLNDMPKPKLVLNGAGQNSCSLLTDIASKDSTMVTYCPGESNKAAISKNGLKSNVFSLPNWLQRSSHDDIEQMVGTLASYVEEGKLTAWLQRVKFDDLPAALQEGSKAQRKLVAIMSRP